MYKSGQKRNKYSVVIYDVNNCNNFLLKFEYALR
jgi:hypothetical protein